MSAINYTEIGHAWLKGRLQYVYTSPDKSSAECIGYYESGALKFRYAIVHEKLHGIGRNYYENGQLEAEEIYDQEVLDGIVRRWYPTGELLSEISYKQGMYHGYQKEWYRNGRLKHYHFYVNDRQEGVWSEWYDDGNFKEQVPFRDGLHHGILKRWDADGKAETQKVFIRGVLIPGKINKLINSGGLSAQHILSIRNTAIRRVCLEELGYARFLTQVPHEMLDKDDECELVKINWHKREEPIFLVKVKCPSTGAFYALRVPPHMKTVKKAIAWTFGMREEEYKPQQEA